MKSRTEWRSRIYRTFGMIVLCGIAFVLLRSCIDFEDNNDAIVTWKATGLGTSLKVLLLDRAGGPTGSRWIFVDTYSGRVSQQTDEFGLAYLDVHEEITAIWVEQIRVMSRDPRPILSTDLEVVIHLK
jgi:hypothetical protein